MNNILSHPISSAELRAMTVQVVSEVCGISVLEIRGSGREMEVVFARHLAMWILRKRQNIRMLEIARFFHRCWGDVHYAVASIDNRIEINKDGEAQIAELADRIERIIVGRLARIFAPENVKEDGRLCC